MPDFLQKVQLAEKERKTKKIARYNRLSLLADSQAICS